MSPEPKPRFAEEERHVRVESAQPAPDPNVSAAPYEERVKVSKSKMIKILFLAANPFDAAALRLDEEIKIIEEKIRQAKFGDRFEIKKHSSIRADELQGFLLQHKPNIVHFSGHGSSSSEIVLENSSGQSHPVSAKALSTLFSLLAGDICLVVLNACYTETQAPAIAEHIGVVIGMSSAIRDSSAIAFAASFYQALAYGRGVRTAFNLACLEIALANLGEEDTPKLLGSNVSTNVFDCDKLARGLVAGSDRKRMQAAKQLTSTPHRHLTALLINRSTTEPNATVRHWINRALGKVGSAAAKETLLKNINDLNPFARLGAEDALKECGEIREAAGDSSSSP